LIDVLAAWESTSPKVQQVNIPKKFNKAINHSTHQSFQIQVSQESTIPKLGGGFKYFLFPPLPGEDEPILTVRIFFQLGWFNHQLENISDL